MRGVGKLIPIVWFTGKLLRVLGRKLDKCKFWKKWKMDSMDWPKFEKLLVSAENYVSVLLPL